MNKKLLMATLLVACAGLAGSGCLVVQHEHPSCVGSSCNLAPGSIAFYWSFALDDGSVSDWCDVAGVSWVDVYVYDAYGDIEFQALNRPCGDTGAIIDNFTPGLYDLDLVGICPSGTITHEGWWTIDIGPGYNDLGVLVLDYLAPCQ